MNLSEKKFLDGLPKYNDWLIDSLKNKKKSIAYLQTAIEEYQEDSDPAPLLLAIHHVALAQGGMAELAKKTNLNRETLYRTLSAKGNPRLKTVGHLLRALGFRLTVKSL